MVNSTSAPDTGAQLYCGKEELVAFCASHARCCECDSNTKCYHLRVLRNLVKKCTIPIYLRTGDAKRADDMHSCGAVLLTAIVEAFVYNGRPSTYFLGFISLMLPQHPRMSKSIKWNMSLSDKCVSPPEFVYCIPTIATHLQCDWGLLHFMNRSMWMVRGPRRHCGNE